MKILVFSDTHLRLPFEEKKFNFLKSIIQKADQVIINGDFWDGYIITFDQFINSPWKHLFPLLKKKKTIYVFGNHDKKIFIDKRVSFFSFYQTYHFQLKINGSFFNFEHGDQLSPAIDGILKIKKAPSILQKLLINFHDHMLQVYGKSFLNQFFTRRNKIIKKRIKNKLKKGEFLVCGHSHYPEVDEKNRFANSGTIGGGFASYLLIDEKGKIWLKEERY